MFVLQGQVWKCEKCRENVKELELAEEKKTKESIGNVAKEDPQLARALERIRELELELAQTKLERVEAECWKQELTHQLHATLAELQTAKTSWIHKTISSIKEVANNKKDNELLLNQITDIPSSDVSVSSDTAELTGIPAEEQPSQSLSFVTFQGGELIKKVFAARRAAKESAVGNGGAREGGNQVERGGQVPAPRRAATPCLAAQNAAE